MMHVVFDIRRCPALLATRSPGRLLANAPAREGIRSSEWSRDYGTKARHIACPWRVTRLPSRPLANSFGVVETKTGHFFFSGSYSYNRDGSPNTAPITRAGQISK